MYWKKNGSKFTMKFWMFIHFTFISSREHKFQKNKTKILNMTLIACDLF